MGNYITKHSSALSNNSDGQGPPRHRCMGAMMGRILNFLVLCIIEMTKVLPTIDVLGYDGQNSSFSFLLLVQIRHP